MTRKPVNPWEKLARKMLWVIEGLGGSPTARIDAREWLPYFQKKIRKLKP